MPLPQDLKNAAHDSTEFLKSFLWPALVGLSTLAAGAVLKFFQEGSRSHRSVELTDRIAKLAKDIHEFPDIPPGKAAVPPCDALRAELELAVNELRVLQTKAPRHFRDVTSSASSLLRSAFLLYKPESTGKRTFQILFYISALLFVVWTTALIVVATPDLKSHRGEDWVVDSIALAFMIGLSSVPPALLRYFAVRKPHARNTLPEVDGTQRNPGTANGD